VTLPTGEVDTGLSADALRTKLFAAARWRAGALTLTGHAGVRFNEGGEVAGAPVDGTVAAAVGIGAIYPTGERLVLVGEATWEGERFDGGEPDARALAGLTWAPLSSGMVRAAVVFGLAEGAPDSELRLGYAFEF
jgi:hypothetical protein